MKLMRDFVTDGRLHKALDAVEAWLGYKIKAVPMPDDHRHRAVCGMGTSEITKEFELWCIEEKPQSQATYCHELAHAVVWISGGPTSYSIEPKERRTDLLYFESIDRSWQLIQHIPVWELTREMGFDESDDDSSYMESLAREIFHGQLRRGILFTPRTPHQAIDLAFWLSRPAMPEVRARVRKIAGEMLPQALELADTMLLNIGKRSLLSVPECEAALNYLLDIIKVPRESLTISSLDRTYPNFSSRVLAAIRTD